MTTARARRYPQPPPAETVLHGTRCDHGELDGRCPLCRCAGDQDPSEPAGTRPARRPARATAPPGRLPAPGDVGQDAPVADDDDQDPRSVDWWDR